MIAKTHRSIYLASSWKNPIYPTVLGMLQLEGHDVYDFREANSAFTWNELDPMWEDWAVNQYLRYLRSDKAERAFCNDMDALKRCDTCVMLTPCGRSASLELGYAVGARKDTFVLYAEDNLRKPVAAELMLCMARWHYNLYTEQAAFLQKLREPVA